MNERFNFDGGYIGKILLKLSWQMKSSVNSSAWMLKVCKQLTTVYTTVFISSQD